MSMFALGPILGFSLAAFTTGMPEDLTGELKHMTMAPSGKTQSNGAVPSKDRLASQIF